MEKIYKKVGKRKYEVTCPKCRSSFHVKTLGQIRGKCFSCQTDLVSLLPTNIQYRRVIWYDTGKTLKKRTVMAKKSYLTSSVKKIDPSLGLA